jgi:hypothetical protein
MMPFLKQTITTLAGTLVSCGRKPSGEVTVASVGGRSLWGIPKLPERHARLFFAAFCFSLCFTIRAIRSYGIGWSSGNRRLPFSPA